MRYYLSLGANVGNREQTLRQAMETIEQRIGQIKRCSSFYYSEPWGFQSEHMFCNICCVLETDTTPIDVLHATQDIERELGRTHKSTDGQYEDRTIDIDIIMAYEDKQEITLNTPELTLPHPLWQQRDFVREPLKEIID